MIIQKKKKKIRNGKNDNQNKLKKSNSFTDQIKPTQIKNMDFQKVQDFLVLETFQTLLRHNVHLLKRPDIINLSFLNKEMYDFINHRYSGINWQEAMDAHSPVQSEYVIITQYKGKASLEAYKERTPLILWGHDKMINDVSWSRCGTKIASGSGDITVKIWNAQTGKEEMTMPMGSNFLEGRSS